MHIKKIGISIHESPTIHLIIYLPPCDNSPLYLYNSKGQRATNKTTDTFLSQKWGGIIISNPTAGECSKWMSNQEKVEININTHSVMHAALFLLRRIIDIHVDVRENLFYCYILKYRKIEEGIYSFSYNLDTYS